MQAASIAHGCAATLARFACLDKKWAEAWGVDPDHRDNFDGTTAELDEKTGRITAV